MSMLAYTATSVCALGWVKCREHTSLLVILCIIVYVTNKAHLSSSHLISIHTVESIAFQSVLHLIAYTNQLTHAF